MAIFESRRPILVSQPIMKEVLSFSLFLFATSEPRALGAQSSRVDGKHRKTPICEEFP